MIRASRARPQTPPTTPPTIAPILLELPLEAAPVDVLAAAAEVTVVTGNVEVRVTTETVTSPPARVMDVSEVMTVGGGVETVTKVEVEVEVVEVVVGVVLVVVVVLVGVVVLGGVVVSWRGEHTVPYSVVNTVETAEFDVTATEVNMVVVSSAY